MKLLLLSNAIPLDFNEQVPVFHKSFNSVRKKKVFLVVFLTYFASDSDFFIG
jgi:hypothetical protein